MLGAVFILSVVICGAIGIWSVLAPDAVAGSANALTGFALTTLDWLFQMLCTSFVVLGAVLALGPYGKIKHGADDDELEFSTLSWIAMLFAGGMGAGLLFWGPAEPMYYFTDPPGLEGSTPEAARLAMVLTNLHWGLHAWSISCRHPRAGADHPAVPKAAGGAKEPLGRFGSLRSVREVADSQARPTA
jgi:glycine betaine transporter